MFPSFWRLVLEKGGRWLCCSAGFVILEKENPMVMLASSAGSLVLKKVKPVVMVASSGISFVLEEKRADGGSTLLSVSRFLTLLSRSPLLVSPSLCFLSSSSLPLPLSSLHSSLVFYFFFSLPFLFSPLVVSLPPSVSAPLCFFCFLCIFKSFSLPLFSFYFLCPPPFLVLFLSFYSQNCMRFFIYNETFRTIIAVVTVER